MDAADQLERVEEIADVPRMDVGAPAPIIFAEEHALVLSYWAIDHPPYHPTKAPIVLVRFQRSYYHQFGPPGEEAIEGHPLAARGLDRFGAFRVHNSSLIRRLEQMDSVHRCHDPEWFKPLRHYIWTFHDSTFECVARDFRANVVQVGEDEATTVMWDAFRKEREDP